MSRAFPCPTALTSVRASVRGHVTFPPGLLSRRGIVAPARSRTRPASRKTQKSTRDDTHRRYAGDTLDRLQIALKSLPEDRRSRAARDKGDDGMNNKLNNKLNTKDVLDSIKSSSSLAMAVPFIALPLVPFGSISTTLSTAFAELSRNYVFSCGFVGWFCAQALKIFTKWYKTGTFDPMAFFDSGGMPSSHSSLCAAMTTAVAIHHGLSSSLFAACTCFTVIVMYDAMGVRRHAGLQAQVLNAVVDDLLEDHPVSGRKLKEVLGHTPRQVMMGGLLGVLIGLVFPH